MLSEHRREGFQKIDSRVFSTALDAADVRRLTSCSQSESLLRQAIGQAQATQVFTYERTSLHSSSARIACRACFQAKWCLY